MSGGIETEARFYVLHLETIQTRLHDLAARLIQARVLETNLRFDLPMFCKGAGAAKVLL